MTKRVLALITLTILAAAGTILFYNSSTAANKFAPVAIISNSNVFTSTGIQSQKEIAHVCIEVEITEYIQFI
jgi:hypothetical protein